MKTLSELAKALGLELRNTSGEGAIRLVASSATAGEDAIVFAEEEATLRAAFASRAGAVFTTARLLEVVQGDKPVLVARQPRLEFARAAKL